MLTFSLQSGSNGNSIYVEAGDVRLLFDAGISGKTAEGRMRVHGRDIRQVDALVISHDHNDHARCLGVYHRKFGVPVHITERTHQALRCQIGAIGQLNYFRAGEPIRFGDVTVYSISTPHDAADGVAFVVEHDGRRLGILTDLGYPFPALTEVLSTLDAVYLESNYDPDMLENGPYPWYLQERIRGRQGHLSNQQSADLISNAGRRLRWAALAHLSQQNNDPELAVTTHRRKLGKCFPLQLAPRYDVSEVFEV